MSTNYYAKNKEKLKKYQKERYLKKKKEIVNKAKIPLHKSKKRKTTILKICDGTFYWNFGKDVYRIQSNRKLAPHYFHKYCSGTLFGTEPEYIYDVGAEDFERVKALFE